MIVLYIVNKSTLVNDTDGQAACNAIQQQLANDFEPAWGASAVLHYVPKGSDPPAGAWTIVLVDKSDEDGALGYHMDASIPSGIVGVQTCIDDGVTWSSCLGHEVLELVADPEAVRLFQFGNLVVPLEVCLTGDTPIAMLDGSRPPIQVLAERGGVHTLWSVDDNGDIVASIGINARQTGYNCPTVAVRLADTTSIRCTADHLFLLADRTYRTARQLSPGDVLFSDISPVGLATHSADRRRADSVFSRQCAAGLGARADSRNILYGELVHPMVFADSPTVPRHAFLGGSIEHIGMMRTEEEVRGIHTRGVVTRMTNLHSGSGINSVAQGIRNPVSEKNPPFLSDLAVSGRTQSPGPYPTGLSLFDTRPKTILERRRASIVRLKSTGSIGGPAPSQALIMQRAQSLRQNATGTHRNTTNSHFKVVYSVEPAGNENVYDLTVPKHHNFLVGAGVFVHNCDASEGVGYTINGVEVSDFCLPAYFIEGSSGPWNHLGTLPGPYPALLPGGYQNSAPLGPFTQSNAEKTRASKRTAAATSRRAKRNKMVVL